MQYYGTSALHGATPGDLAMFAEDLVSIITTFVTDLLAWVSDLVAFILTGLVETID